MKKILGQKEIIVVIILSLALFSSPIFAACSNSCDASTQYSCALSTSTMYKNTKGTLTVSVTNQQSQSQSVTAELTGNWYTGDITSVAGNTYNQGQATSVDFSLTPTSTGAKPVCVKMGTTCTADCGSVTIESNAELSVVSLTPSSSTVSPSSSFTVSATIQNLGSQAAGTSTSVSATLSSSSACTVSSATKTIGTITGSASTSQSWTVTAGSSTGTCSLSLSVSGTPGGSASKTASVTISTTGGGDGGGGGAGGGGGGGGAAANKQSWTSMTTGTEYKMTLTDKTLAFNQIALSLKATVYNTSITVSKLGSQPATVTTPTGTVYQWVDVTPVNLSDANMQTLKIRFNVTRTWLINNSFSPTDVVLQRYSNGWAKLSTSKISETSSNYEYESISPGLSVFAITAERPVAAPTIACGNNIREGAEECDGTDLAGQSCASKGFESGTLRCNNCLFDISNCKSKPVPVCGNGACESGENQENCPTDCKPFEIPEEVKENAWWITVIVLIVVGVLGYFYYHGHKHVKKLVYSYKK